MRYTEAALYWAEGLAPPLGGLVTSFAVGIANNFLNNLPLGLIAGGTLQAIHAKGLIADSVVIGVDLGPNLSVTGSLATILWLIVLRKEKLNAAFWHFLKLGLVAMPVAMLAAVSRSSLVYWLLRTS